VSDPRKAERLVALLHAGATLEDARRTLGSIDVDERSRAYAMDDLQPDLRAEVDTLSAGEWSRIREWRGRSSVFQVVSKEERARSAIPQLGQGLDESEIERLANQQRAIAGRSRPPAETQAGDLQPASVVEQATPQYPPGIEESAEVTVQVEIGMSDDYVGARVVRSTNPQFDQAALDAAQRSSYRSARRNGIPERGNVTLNFRFVAPGQEPPPSTPVPGVPPPQD
jgi:TonB family protein